MILHPETVQALARQHHAELRAMTDREALIAADQLLAMAATATFALEHRVLLARHPNRVPLDIALGALPFEEDSIWRSSLWDIGESALRTCSAQSTRTRRRRGPRTSDMPLVSIII